MKGQRLRLLTALLILPGNAVVFVPALLLYLEGGIPPGFGLAVPAIWVVFCSGALLFGAGFLLAAKTVMLFIHAGEGTPAPWDPPRRLVILGPYRYVRNPMITGAVFMLLAESLLLGSVFILGWSVFFFVANHFYFMLSEEPGLERRFGKAYAAYKQHVPRWIPRLTPYHESDQHNE